jgi:hypothetical protein
MTRSSATERVLSRTDAQARAPGLAGTITGMRYLFPLLLVACAHGETFASRVTKTVTAESACQQVTVADDPEGEGWLWLARGCSKESWCWITNPGDKMRCAEKRPKAVREELARNALRCPEGKLDEEAGPGDWTTFMGCDRRTACSWERTDDVVCRGPEDFELARQQLSVETGCPVESIEQLQFFGTNTQHTYRLNACGNQSACMVPIVQDRAASRFGSQISCKAVPATATSN